VGAQEAPVSIDCSPPVPEAAGFSQGGKNPVGVVGDGRKIASLRVIRDFGIFKEGHFPIWGLMAQVEQKRLFFKIGAGSSDTENDASDIYIDLAAALTAVNRKQYHQAKTNGDPLCYHISITNVATSKAIMACTAPNTWTTRNAAKKTAVGWKAQMKHAGIKLRDLPPYARRFRCAIEKGAVDGAVNTQHLALHLRPNNCDGTSLFDQYLSPDGGAVTYENANDVVLLPISEDDPDEAYKAVLTGKTEAGNMIFGMIDEFLKSRRNMREETDMSTEFPDDDGLMNTLFAVSEELADDVVAAVDAYSITRPYSESNATELNFGCYLYPPEGGVTSIESLEVPLGLIKFQNPNGWTEDDMFFIDVHAIYEM